MATCQRNMLLLSRFVIILVLFPVVVMAESVTIDGFRTTATFTGGLFLDQFNPINMIDGVPATAWVSEPLVEGRYPSGVYAAIYVLFYGTDSGFDAIEMLPGYYSEDKWEEYSRPRIITLSDPMMGIYLRIEIEDKMKPVRIDLSKAIVMDVPAANEEVVARAFPVPYRPAHGDYLPINIEAVYPGSKNMVAISEIAFYLRGKKLKIFLEKGDVGGPHPVIDEGYLKPIG